MTPLHISPTAIDGLLIVTQPLHQDRRGWFKEAWQQAKMTALGLPAFTPVQQNVAHNDPVGVTRGFHAEPWDKLVGVTSGKALGAWVDLRPGPGFGRVVTHELTPDVVVFVPRGVANAYQTVAEQTTYSYLVNRHWSAEATRTYVFVNLFDPTLGISWPFSAEHAVLSESDRNHPWLSEISAMTPPRALVFGSGGQLGEALLAEFPDAEAMDHTSLDISDADAVSSYDFSRVGTIINAAAYTAVDEAETPAGRVAAWRTNAQGTANLAAVAREFQLRLVQFSTDYVFDGSRASHLEDEPFSPLGVYGQTKAAGDLAATSTPEHWIIRTSWLVGAGRNFVSTMAAFADRGTNPMVVDDQFGRLTFTDDLARGTRYLLEYGEPGCYNLTNTGTPQSWADVARDVFQLTGRNPEDVTPVSTDIYCRGRHLAPRPRHSDLDLRKICAAGFEPPSAAARLASYLAVQP